MLPENIALYHFVESYREHLKPMRSFIKLAQYHLDNPLNPVFYTPANNYISASYAFIDRFTKGYPKPTFDIEEVEVRGHKCTIKQYNFAKKTFCNLIHFEKADAPKQEKLLVVAPMSGHHATLLRGTVYDLLPHFDVYITDWIDAREIPYNMGSFDMDDFIDYVTEFLELLGPRTNVMAVCQPTVPVLAAVSLMATQGNPATPKGMILMGGPVDARQSPTEVNRFATQSSMNYFESMLITRVPFKYPGFMRPVYPGFLQLMGFISMNVQRHIGAHFRLFENLVIGDGESAEQHLKFYNEYLSVMDITAEFYLQTIKRVFKDFDLPYGNFTSRGRYVDPASIKDTRLLVIEGENDDISGIGQTKAAIDLCKNLPPSHSYYHLQENVGHYGVFNGRRFRESIVPVISDFICDKFPDSAVEPKTDNKKKKKA